MINEFKSLESKGATVGLMFLILCANYFVFALCNSASVLYHFLKKFSLFLNSLSLCNFGRLLLRQNGFPSGKWKVPSDDKLKFEKANK